MIAVMIWRPNLPKRNGKRLAIISIPLKLQLYQATDMAQIFRAREYSHTYDRLILTISASLAVITGEILRRRQLAAPTRLVIYSESHLDESFRRHGCASTEGGS